MKKYIAMILTLVLALSLCACGNNSENNMNANTNLESNPTSESSVPSEPSVPEIPNLDMFVGTWKLIEANSYAQAQTFTINADYTMTCDGEAYTWTADELSASSIYEMEITVKDQSDSPVFTIRLQRTPDDTYSANFRNYGNVMGSGTDFYRDEDYSVVELTEENVLEYVETENKFVFDTDKEGFTKSVAHKLYIRFKDSVGYLSNGNVNFTAKGTYQNVRFEAKPGNHTLGEVKSTSDSSSLNGVWLSGGSESYCYTTTWWVSQPGEAFETAFTFYELIGADWCNGRVFILK